MASRKQIAANRQNAKKGTGPRTPQGLATSSMNAITDSQPNGQPCPHLTTVVRPTPLAKHGLDAKSEVIRCESQPDYETLIAEYYARYHPTVPEERDLVDMLIQSVWLRRRYMSIDAGIWERGFYDTGGTSLGFVFEKSQNAFDKAGRRINSAQRNYQQALKQLLELRANRAEQAAGQPDDEPDDTPDEISEIAAPENTAQDEPTEPLNLELVSFRETVPETPEIHPPEPITGEDPPKAA
jgi:hypothetical protein